jgi:hypothetical protein
MEGENDLAIGTKRYVHAPFVCSHAPLGKVLGCRKSHACLIFVSVLKHPNLQVENEETLEAQSARTEALLDLLQQRFSFVPSHFVFPPAHTLVCALARITPHLGVLHSTRLGASKRAYPVIAFHKRRHAVHRATPRCFLHHFAFSAWQWVPRFTVPQIFWRARFSSIRLLKPTTGVHAGNTTRFRAKRLEKSNDDEAMGMQWRCSRTDVRHGGGIRAGEGGGRAIDHRACRIAWYS